MEADPERGSEPSYLRLHESGELVFRAEKAVRMLESCNMCPNTCGVDRLQNERDVCSTGRYAVVSSAFPHHGEEDVLRGWRGSGTIFFSHCNLLCVFCQNHDISHEGAGREVTPDELGTMMLNIQDMGCHNLNLVTPSHVVPQILEALVPAVVGGLRIPIVYNTSGFDSIETLSLLDGIVDIYMPDIKFITRENSRKYTNSGEYSSVIKKSIVEMHRQVGDLVMDENGIAKRGLLVRHLVMPSQSDETREIVEFLAEEISEDTALNIMGQYSPAGELTKRSGQNEERFEEIQRRPALVEIQEALSSAEEAGLHRFL